jgi:heme-degrading monooxygenase HmoA
MPYLFIRHKVADYPKWKSAFDEHGSTRQTNGSRGGQLFRSANDPNELIMLFEWDDLERARQFTQSEDLRQVMQQAGVADQPDTYFLEAVEHIPV